MKKLLIVLVCLISLGLGPKTEWYVEFYSTDKTIHKCARDKFLEYKELLDVDCNHTEKQIQNYYRIRINESKIHTKSHQK